MVSTDYTLCVCVPCKGGREFACGGRLVSVATWPSVVRMSAECINVANQGGRDLAWRDAHSRLLDSSRRRVRAGIHTGRKWDL